MTTRLFQGDYEYEGQRYQARITVQSDQKITAKELREKAEQVLHDAIVSDSNFQQAGEKHLEIQIRRYSRSDSWPATVG